MYPHTVYGALLGMQKGRSVDVCNSFELVVSSVEGRTVLDKEYFTAKEAQCRCSPCAVRHPVGYFFFICRWLYSLVPRPSPAQVLILLILQTAESWAGPQCICPVLYMHVQVVVAPVSTTGMVATESVNLVCDPVYCRNRRVASIPSNIYVHH